MNQCSECRLEFAAPPFAVPEEWYARFEKYGPRWEYGECVKDLSPGGLVLDVGCGEGYFLRAQPPRPDIPRSESTSTRLRLKAGQGGGLHGGGGWFGSRARGLAGAPPHHRPPRYSTLSSI